MIQPSLTPEKTHQQERLEQALEKETIEAMIKRYADRDQPIDGEGYISGSHQQV